MRRTLRTVAMTILTLVIVGALIWLGDVHRGLQLLRHMRCIYLAWFGAFLLCYEASRYVLWLLLLNNLKVASSRRAQLFAFAVGEAVKFVPTGAYAQNAVLARTTGADLARSSAATTLIILAEIAVAFAVVLALGVNGWSAWTRLAVLAIAAAVVLVLRRARAAGRAPAKSGVRLQGGIPAKIVEQVRRLQEGAGELLRPRPLAQTLALTLLYEVFAGLGLYVAVRSLGIGNVSALQAIAVNCFGLAFYVVLGSLEVAAAGAFVAMGVDRSAAVTAVLVNRTLGVLGTFVLSGIIIACCREQWSLMLRRRRPRREKTAPSGRQSSPLPANDA